MSKKSEDSKKGKEKSGESKEKKVRFKERNRRNVADGKGRGRRKEGK